MQICWQEFCYKVSFNCQLLHKETGLLSIHVFQGRYEYVAHVYQLLSSQQGTASRLVKLDPHIIMSQVPQELHLSVRPLRN